MGKSVYKQSRLSDATKRALWDFTPPGVLAVILVIALSTMAPEERRMQYLIAGLTGLVLVASFIYWRLRRR